MTHPLIIIGAGPAGLFCAVQASRHGLKTLVLEKMPAPGRKLLLTGGGACNFTNARPIREFLACYGANGRFLKPSLLNFTNLQAIAFFESLGVPSRAEEGGGKVFPKSRRAQDALDALLKACPASQVEIRCAEPVASIRAMETKGFEVATERAVYSCEKLCLATGGCSFPSTGSSGDGFSLARSLGHSLKEPRPGLCPFTIKNHPLAGLSGTSFKGLEISLWQGGKRKARLSGDLVVTHQGISGPAVHNLARFAVPGDTVSLRFLTDPAMDELGREGPTLAAFLKRPPMTRALAGLILEKAGLKETTQTARLDRGRRKTLAALLTAFPLEIASLAGFDAAMVTCGGVDLAEVNPKTMESRVRPGLFFAGEILDIDGDSGGYDLQAAWSTGYLAGTSAAMKLSRPGRVI